MSPNIYRITLKRVTRLFSYLFVYIYFHVMTDVYFREKYYTSEFNWAEKQYLYTCVLRIIKE